MSRNNLLIAAVILLVGLIVGYAAGSGGPNLRDIDAVVGKRVDAAMAAQDEKVAALGTRIDDLTSGLDGKVEDLGSRLDGIASKVDAGSQAVSGVSDKIGSDITDLGKEIGDLVQSSGASHLAALESGFSDLRSEMKSGSGGQPAAAAASSGTGGGAKPASSKQATAAASGTPPAGQAAGDTAILSDGKVRVFVSRVDDDAGKARLTINGTAATLAPGESKTFTADGQDCRVTLAALDRGHVVVAGGCGSDLPAPEGTPAGSTATLDDGVRVFVSGVTADGARIAVNGFDTKTVKVGEAVDVQMDGKACTVTVQGIDRGRVSLDSNCGS